MEELCGGELEEEEIFVVPLVSRSRGEDGVTGDEGAPTSTRGGGSGTGPPCSAAG
jgi:hypothetical protein